MLLGKCPVDGCDVSVSYSPQGVRCHTHDVPLENVLLTEILRLNQVIETLLGKTADKSLLTDPSLIDEGEWRAAVVITHGNSVLELRGNPDGTELVFPRNA